MDNSSKKYRKPTKTEKTYLKSAKRDIKGKTLSEAQKTSLKKDMDVVGGQHSNVHQKPKSQRDAAIRRKEENIKALTETRLGQRVQKLSDKRGGEYNVQKMQYDIDVAKQNSSFKNNSKVFDKFNRRG